MSGDADEGGGSTTDGLRSGLTRLTKQVDDAVTALDGAEQAAEDAYDHFMGLGGSGDRAQVVVDLIQDLHKEVTGLETFTDEVGSAIDEVDHAITPEENIDKLEAVIEKLKTVKSETDAVVATCDDAEREIHENLRGSDRADEIADQVTAARDELDEARTGIDDIAEQAKAQQAEFRGNE
jgi:hypothetical protein